MTDQTEEGKGGGRIITIIEDIDSLPPLPTPKPAMRHQAIGGVCLVLSLLALFIALMHGVALTVGSLPPAAWWIVFSLTYVETIVVLVCLLGLVVTDPGVIQRTTETCSPIPPEMALVLESSGEEEHNNRPRANIKGENDGDTYCVRCLVWRRKEAATITSKEDDVFVSMCNRTNIHHCNTCQRCVMHFDHHCAVFGRCIAGKGLQGNFKYFVGIIASGMAAYVTCLCSIGVSLYLRYDVWWVMVLLPVVAYMSLMCVNRRMSICSPFTILIGCVIRCVWRCWKIGKKCLKKNRDAPRGEEQLYCEVPQTAATGAVDDANADADLTQKA